jgi:hypothetical protein
MWYDVSEVPSAAIVRPLLLSEELCSFSLSKAEIAGEILDF